MLLTRAPCDQTLLVMDAGEEELWVKKFESRGMQKRKANAQDLLPSPSGDEQKSTARRYPWARKSQQKSRWRFFQSLPKN